MGKMSEPSPRFKNAVVALCRKYGAKNKTYEECMELIRLMERIERTRKPLTQPS